MSSLTFFFKDADTQVGEFYPNHYLLALFPNLADADEERRKLQGDYEVVSASGQELLDFAAEHRRADGLWGELMTDLSRMLGTGASDSDHDLEAAQNGAGFLAVFCPNQEVKAEVWKLLAPAKPVVARYYSLGGIEHM